MPPHLSRSTALLGLLAVTAATLICISITAVIVNAQCQAVFDSHRPIYPGAEVVGEENSFLGRKMMVLYTPDAAVEVDGWYNRTYALALQADVQNQTQTTWRGIWAVELASDRPGSVITLKVPCGQY